MTMTWLRHVVVIRSHGAATRDCAICQQHKAEGHDTEVVVEGAQVLPNVVGDAVCVEAEEQLLAEDRGEREGNVAKKTQAWAGKGVRGGAGCRRGGCRACQRAGVRRGKRLGRT
jgi:hypothetical protein